MSWYVNWFGEIGQS